jgi:hypothetical protein
MQAAHATSARVYAEQVGGAGQRVFWVLQPVHAWLALQQSRNASLYEVLGRQDRCRLFLDVEYDRASNPGRTSDMDAHAVQQLVSLIASAAGPDISFATPVVLEASSAARFSQHVLLHVAGRAHGVYGTLEQVGSLVQAAVACWQQHALLSPPCGGQPRGFAHSGQPN